MVPNRTLSLAFLICSLQTSSDALPSISRTEFYVESDPGISIYLREVRACQNTADNGPILLVHGARVPGVPSFDLPVPGGSLAEDLAKAGFVVYLIDLRGYGHSTRPPEMSEPPEKNPPLVRCNQASRDIDAAVNSIQKRTGWNRFSILGWATGGQWAGYYASLHSAKLSHLVIHNAL
jgi:alpha-beta hydrolase superfamily lysophospholipase